MRTGYKLLFALIGILLCILIFRVAELNAHVEKLTQEIANCITREEFQRQQHTT